MIKATFTSEIVERLLSIERCRERFGGIRVPIALTNKMRKSSRKKSSYASTKIEGNPLTEEQADEAIESSRRHYLKPEQEVRNYFRALKFLEGELKKRTQFSKALILAVQEIVVEGESAEKKGLRGPMPSGVLFAVYDDKTGAVDYIPPEANDIEPLLDELIGYVAASADNPIIKAAIVHYQLVTIHPFEDGNGRTARLLSDYILDLSGYGFNQIGSLEEYFAYDIDEYYRSLQMGLPAVYYDGRANPPHPEVWFSYFVRMMELHVKKALEMVSAPEIAQAQNGLSHLTPKERKFLAFLAKHDIGEFSPIELARRLKVTNRTIINWCAGLVKNGFLAPDTSCRRTRTYTLTPLAAAANPTLP